MMLPSSFQDYGAEYFQCVFEKAATAFRRADVVLFVGYTFPPEDILIRRLTALLVEDQNPHRKKQLICINRSDTDSVKKRLMEVFGETGPATPELVVRSMEFKAFCEGCNYYYRKLRDLVP